MPRHIARGNATPARIRVAIEHVFAAQKQRLRLVVRTVGMARATTKLGLANLAYNLLRFTRLEGRRACIAPPARANRPTRPAIKPGKS